MTIEETLEAAIRERCAKESGVAMAALWIASDRGDIYGKRVLEGFGIDEKALREADAVERIECYGAGLDDAIALLKL